MSGNIHYVIVCSQCIQGLWFVISLLHLLDLLAGPYMARHQAAGHALQDAVIATKQTANLENAAK